MKILFVCSGNFRGSFEHAQVFVYEQMQSIQSLGLSCDVFLVKGKGLTGYLSNILLMRKHLRKEHYDILHAVYGLSGLVTVFQNQARLVTTFIGSDIHGSLKPVARIISKLSDHSIFVERKMPGKVGKTTNYSIIPFGVDLSVFNPSNKEECRKNLGLDLNSKVILFSSSFTNKVKNYPLASRAIELLDFPIQVFELGKSYGREELNILFNACDLMLMTSFSEGSPQVIKEAMACNCPIVATDVGDISEVIGDTEGCYITSFDPNDVAEKIKLALVFGKRTNGRKKIAHLDNRIIAGKIVDVYREVLRKR